MRGYDNWKTSAPESPEWIEKRLEELEPPHRSGDDCPRCGEASCLVLIACEDTDRISLYCESCYEDIEPTEDPTWEYDGGCAPYCRCRDCDGP